MKSYERYAARRNELGYTDKEVSEKTGISLTSLEQWYMNYLTRGILGNQPKLETLLAIAGVLGIGILDFIK